MICYNSVNKHNDNAIQGYSLSKSSLPVTIEMFYKYSIEDKIHAFHSSLEKSFILSTNKIVICLNRQIFQDFVLIFLTNSVYGLSVRV